MRDIYYYVGVLDTNYGHDARERGKIMAKMNMLMRIIK